MKKQILFASLAALFSSAAFAQSGGFQFKYLTPVYASNPAMSRPMSSMSTSTSTYAPAVAVPSSSRFVTVLGVGAAKVSAAAADAGGAMGLQAATLVEFGRQRFSFSTGAMYLREGASESVVEQAGVPLLGKYSLLRRSHRWSLALGGMPAYAFAQKAVSGVALASLSLELPSDGGGGDKRIGLAYDRSSYAQSAMLTFGIGFAI